MKINAFQKLVIIICLLVFTMLVVFNIPTFPYYYENENLRHQGFIWSSSKVDYSRLLMYVGILSVIFFFIFKYYEKYNKVNEVVYKTHLKKEIRFFLIVIIGFVFSLIFLFSNNIINNYKKEQISKELALSKKKIVIYDSIKDVRQNFYFVTKKIFDISEMNNSIINLWSFLVERKNDSIWLEYFNSKYSIAEKNEFNIQTPSKLKEFIEYNYISIPSVNNEVEKILIQNSLRKNLYSSYSNFDNNEISKYSFLSLLSLIGVFYILRPLYTTVVNIFKEAK